MSWLSSVTLDIAGVLPHGNLRPVPRPGAAPSAALHPGPGELHQRPRRGVHSHGLVLCVHVEEREPGPDPGGDQHHWALSHASQTQGGTGAHLGQCQVITLWCDQISCDCFIVKCISIVPLNPYPFKRICFYFLSKSVTILWKCWRQLRNSAKSINSPSDRQPGVDNQHRVWIFERLITLDTQMEPRKALTRSFSNGCNMSSSSRLLLHLIEGYRTD